MGVEWQKLGISERKSMTEETPTTQKKRIKERSASYPSISIQEAIDYSIKLQTAYGKSAFSRENAVKEMGHEKVTGSSGMKVSALVHFGLLDREGNAYRNSELSIRFANPIDENDLQTAKKIAVHNPKLYKSLLSEYSGRAIPTALNSILVRNHKIGQKVAASVATVFRKSIEEAGIYQNGIIINETSVNEEINTQIPPTVAQNMPLPTPQGGSHPTVLTLPSDMITVEFPSGIALSYPKNLAFSFAMGVFGEQTAALEDAVQKEVKKHEPNDTKDDISPTS